MVRTLIIAMALIACGCAASNPAESRMPTTSSEPYRVPPKEMVAIVKEVIAAPPFSLGVQEEKQGMILTGYQRFPGDWHIGRRWQERTQYRISVIPDFSDPAGAAILEVREFTEQRAAEGMRWEDTGELRRPERAKELLEKLDVQLRARQKEALSLSPVRRGEG